MILPPEPISSAADGFITAAVAPLADDAEIQFAARHQLALTVAAAAGTRGDSLEVATQRFEIAGAAPGKKFKTVLYACVALVSLAGLISSGLMVRGWVGAAYLVRASIFSESLDNSSLTDGLTPQEQLLLLGDPTQSEVGEQKKALWDSAPDNPAYYADYLSAFLFKEEPWRFTPSVSTSSTMPDDVLEVASRIDPDNAYFTILTASTAATQALNVLSVTDSYSSPTPTTVVDPAKFDEAIALLERAANQPRWDNYRAAMLRERIPLLPSVVEYSDRLLPMFYLETTKVPTTYLDSLPRAIDCRAAALAAAGDRDGFAKLVATWEKVCVLFANSTEPGIVDAKIVRKFVTETADVLLQSATTLGAPEAVVRLQLANNSIKDAITAADSLENQSNYNSDYRGSLFVRSERRSSSAIIRDDDLKPGRLADHAIFGRFAWLVAWLVLGIFSLGAFLYRFRGSRLTRRLALRMTSLLGPRDWLWIIGAGVILPVAYYQAVYRVSKFGLRDWAIITSDDVVPFRQLLVLTLLLIALPIVIASARLGMRAGAAGLASKNPWPLALTSICGLLALPLVGVGHFADFDPAGTLASIFTKIFAVVILVVAARALFSRTYQLLRRMAIARAIAPAYATGMLAIAANILVCHLEERHWIARDHLLEITPEAPASSRYEYLTAQAMQEETIEFLGEAVTQ